MATWVIFGKYVENLFDATTKMNLDTGGDTLKMGLLDAEATPDATSTGDEVWNDVSATQADEIEGSGDGYTAGGPTISGQVVNIASGEVNFDIADVEFATDADGDTDIRFAVIYDETVTDNLVAYADLDSNRSVQSGDLDLIIGAEGVFNSTIAT